MLHPHLPTMLLSFSLCNVVSLVVVISLWRQSRHQYAGTHLWMAYYLLQLLGGLLLLGRGQIPDVLSIVLANAMLVGGVLLLHKGLADFLEYRYDPRPGRLLLVVFLLIHSYFALVDNNAHVRNLNASVVLALFSAMLARMLLLRVPAAKRPAAAIAGWTLVIYSATSVLRALLEWTLPAQSLQAFSSPQTVYFVVAYQVLSLMLSFSMALMVNRLLMNDLRAQLADLVQARSAAEEANRSKSAFLANMSHEIRTPLNAVLGMTHMALRAGPSPKQREFLQKIQRSGKHLLAVISDILDFSKIEANKLVLEEGPLDLEALVANVVGMLESSARDKGLQLTHSVDPMPAALRGDATRLGQALLNYAGNAVKFTESGAIHLHAALVEEAADTVLVRLEVQDTGVGIPANKLATLFEPFVQADDSTTRRYGGSGLGLAITRRLAEAMHGQVGLSSVAGQGSRFWFTARLRKGAPAQPHEQPLAEPNPAALLKQQFSGRRVLLAEDDAFSSELAQILLQEVGLLVDMAWDGQAAAEMAAAGSYDLVLMDMQMPVLDGLQATQRMRRAGATVPIVAVTANAFFEDKRRCLDAGMDDFVTKPVDPAALYTVLLRQLQRASP